MPPALGLLVIPAWPLRRRTPVTFEHPVSELPAHGEHAAEETCIAQRLYFAQARQKQLVLHDAVLDLLGFREFGDRKGLVETVGPRLFAIDVFAGLDGARQ